MRTTPRQTRIDAGRSEYAELAPYGLGRKAQALPILGSRLLEDRELACVSSMVFTTFSAVMIGLPPSS
jgi:hypothetical protein